MTAGVLFDVDGTLLDANYLHVLAWSRALRRHGEDQVTMSQIHDAIGIASESLLDKLIGHASAEISDCHAEEYQRLRGEVRPLPGAAALLAHCRQQGLLVALVTSGGSDDLDWMLPALAGSEGEAPVDGTVTADDVDASKPDPDPWLTALQKFRLDAAGTVAVGDTAWDVEAAVSAGVTALAVTTGGISRHTLHVAGAAQVYTSPQELLDSFDNSPLADIAAGASAPHSPTRKD